MEVLFRVDASISIGTGHVMRCLTLADGLRAEGYNCRFACRDHPGNLLALISNRGYRIYTLPLTDTPTKHAATSFSNIYPAHATWLGCNWMLDASQTIDCIGSRTVDWLIVDHYSIEERWENMLRPFFRNIMVIDDLSDRRHDCDLLLDQNYGSTKEKYLNLVPEFCNILTGAQYALLRPEFASFREYSLRRRNNPRKNQILISMGGVDKDNVTSNILQSFQKSNLPKDCKIIVVMGETSPWIDDVQGVAKKLPWDVDIRVNVTNMAQIMADSDFSIGAAGSTAWERCCLGLPTFMTVLAENQRSIAESLCKANAVYLFDNISECADIIDVSYNTLKKMSFYSSAITDGLGVINVIKAINNSQLK